MYCVCVYALVVGVYHCVYVYVYDVWFVRGFYMCCLCSLVLLCVLVYVIDICVVLICCMCVVISLCV